MDQGTLDERLPEETYIPDYLPKDSVARMHGESSSSLVNHEMQKVGSVTRKVSRGDLDEDTLVTLGELVSSFEDGNDVAEDLMVAYAMANHGERCNLTTTIRHIVGLLRGYDVAEVNLTHPFDDRKVCDGKFTNMLHWLEEQGPYKCPSCLKSIQEAHGAAADRSGVELFEIISECFEQKHKSFLCFVCCKDFPIEQSSTHVSACLSRQVKINFANTVDDQDVFYIKPPPGPFSTHTGGYHVCAFSACQDPSMYSGKYDSSNLYMVGQANRGRPKCSFGNGIVFAHAWINPTAKSHYAKHVFESDEGNIKLRKACIQKISEGDNGVLESSQVCGILHCDLTFKDTGRGSLERLAHLINDHKIPLLFQKENNKNITKVTLEELESKKLGPPLKHIGKGRDGEDDAYLFHCFDLLESPKGKGDAQSKTIKKTTGSKSLTRKRQAQMQEVDEEEEYDGGLEGTMMTIETSVNPFPSIPPDTSECPREDNNAINPAIWTSSSLDTSTTPITNTPLATLHNSGKAAPYPQNSMDLTWTENLFDSLPTSAQLEELFKIPIELMELVPNDIFMADPSQSNTTLVNEWENFTASDLGLAGLSNDPWLEVSSDFIHYPWNSNQPIQSSTSNQPIQSSTSNQPIQFCTLNQRETHQQRAGQQSGTSSMAAHSTADRSSSMSMSPPDSLLMSPAVTDTTMLETTVDGTPEQEDGMDKVGEKENFNNEHKILADSTLKCIYGGCGKIFPSRVLLKGHRRNVHYGEESRCTQCDYVAKSKKLLSTHVYYHHSGKCRVKDQVECKVEGCNAKFRKKRLTKHNQEVHGMLPHSCRRDGCSETFATKSELQQHQLLAHSLYNCEVEGCVSTFINGPNFKRHMNKVHGNHTLVCDEENCSSTFRHIRALKKHKRADHSKAIPCGLPGCYRVYRNLGVLNEHRRTCSKGKSTADSRTAATPTTPSTSDITF